VIDFGYGIMLDRINLEDLDQLREWRNDPAVYLWCRQNNLISKQDQLRWHSHQNDDASMKMFLLRAAKRSDQVNFGTRLGVAGLTSIDMTNRNAEFSLYIGPEYQGQGYGGDGLRTLFSYGFDWLGLRRIWGETFEHNPAKHLFKKVGMTEEGTARKKYYKEGAWVDAIQFSILIEESA
jgi:RimJ/RimL family protein N-acetyltransferase